MGVFDFYIVGEGLRWGREGAGFGVMIPPCLRWLELGKIDGIDLKV